MGKKDTHMNAQFILERRHLERIRNSVDMKQKFDLPRDRTVAQRAMTKRKVEKEYAKYEKRIKFRGLAMRFLEWRKERSEDTP